MSTSFRAPTKIYMIKTQDIPKLILRINNEYLTRRKCIDESGLHPINCVITNFNISVFVK